MPDIIIIPKYEGNIERRVHVNGNIILPSKYIEIMVQRNYLILTYNENIEIEKQHIKFDGKPVLLMPTKKNENIGLLQKYFSKLKKPLGMDECIHLIEKEGNYSLVGTMDLIVMGATSLIPLKIDDKNKINIPSAYRKEIGLEKRLYLCGSDYQIKILPHQGSFQK